MSNSTDNANLSEDSDVIELTDEIAAAAKNSTTQPTDSGGDPNDSMEDDFAMPEFRLPGAASDGDAPGAAIMGGKHRRGRRATPALQTLKLHATDIQRAQAKATEQAAAVESEVDTILAEQSQPQSIAASSSPVEDEPPLSDESSAIYLESEVEVIPGIADLSDEIVLDEVSEVEDANETADTSVYTPPHVSEDDIDLDNAETQVPWGSASSSRDLPWGSGSKTQEIEKQDRLPEPIDASEPTGPIEADPLEPSDSLESNPADVSDEIEKPHLSPSGGFDRQELVRTTQMRAVNREQLEFAIDMERLDKAKSLTHQGFAPDALTAPPRALTTEWSAGAPKIQGPAPVTKPAAQSAPVDPVAESLPPLSQQSDPSIAPPQADPAPSSPPATPPEAMKPAAPKQPAPAGAPSMEVQKPLEQPHVPGEPSPQQIRRETPIMQRAVRQEPKRPLGPRDTWFTEVFNEEFLRSVPKNSEAITEREATFIDRIMSLQDGSRLLDLACGYGRHSFSLAMRKYEVVGLDLSMPLLQRALNEAKRRSLNIKFVHGDMRQMNFHGIFDGCVLWQSSFGYFDDPTNLRVLQGISQALKPGGRFILDLVNRDYVVDKMPSRCWWEGRDCVFLEEVDFDHIHSVVHTKRSYIYEDGSAPLEQNMYVRLYSLHEMLLLLQIAGFRVLDVFGELYTKAKFLGANSTKMIILAEKQVPTQK